MRAFSKFLDGCHFYHLNGQMDYYGDVGGMDLKA